MSSALAPDVAAALRLWATVGGAALALLVSAAVAALVVRCGPVDAPGARTSHRAPTATSGGLAVLIASALGLAAYAMLSPDRHGLDLVGLALFFAVGTGVGGAVDDMVDMPARWRLLIGCLVALTFTALAGPVTRLPLARGLSVDLPLVWGAFGAALWIVTAANAVNFVDGANGYASTGLAIAFAALAAAGFLHGDAPVGAAAACGCAAFAGFIPWNLRGRLFQGDVGALFGAFLFAALCLVGAGPKADGPISLYFGPIALMPWLTDVLLTLQRRAFQKKPLMSAHREHLYQRWLQHTGKPHAALAWRGALIMAAFGALAVAASFTTEGAQAGALLLALVIAVIGWRSIDRRFRPSQLAKQKAHGKD